MAPVELSGEAPRLVRRDVRRNREAILGAARTVFARDGIDAPLDRVATEAGVGGATLYRHFTDRHALWDVVLVDPLQEVLDLITEALALDAKDALRAYLFGVGAIEARRDGFAALMTTRFEGAPRLLEIRSGIQQGLERLVGEAKAAGVIRGDVEHTDFALVAISVAQIIADTGSVAPLVWQRWVGLLWDAFSSPDPSALPTPALRPNQVWRALVRDRATRPN